MRVIYFILILVFNLILINEIKAQEKDWISFLNDDAGVFYYNSDSVQYGGSGQFTLWVKYIFATPKYVLEDNKYIKYELLKWEIQCGLQTIHELEGYKYYVDGTYYHVSNNSSSSNPPSSIGEDLYIKFCK